MPAIPAALAAAGLALLLLPGLLGPYGIFIDELYYLSCARRLAWGYVDHPPLAPLVLAASDAVLDPDLLALRLPAALAGAAAVLGAGLLARRLGAGRAGQAVASGAVLLSPGLHVLSSFFSMNVIEVLLWLACLWIVAEVELRAAPRLFLALGATLGVAFQNKHTIVLLAVTLLAGMLATPARRHLRSPWPWLGVAVAALLAAPNLAWQAAHGWPSLEFYANAAQHKNLAASPIAVLAQQALFLGPAALPVAVAGVVFLWRRRELRHLAIAALALLVILVVTRQSRPDRLAGLYPFLFAAGGAALSRFSLPRAVIGVVLACATLVLAPLVVPAWSPRAVAAYAERLGLTIQLERGAGKRTLLPQWLADRLGWERLADDVRAARDRLTPGERARAVTFAPSYGQAGAVERAGLGPVHGTHNSWFLWGPPPDPVDVAIVIGDRREHLEELFEEVELATVHDCELCMPWRDDTPIWIVRRARGSIAARWGSWKHYE
jgi:hypothetical protein